MKDELKTQLVDTLRETKEFLNDPYGFHARTGKTQEDIMKRIDVAIDAGTDYIKVVK